MNYLIASKKIKKVNNMLFRNNLCKMEIHIVCKNLIQITSYKAN